MALWQLAAGRVHIMAPVPPSRARRGGRRDQPLEKQKQKQKQKHKQKHS